MRWPSRRQLIERWPLRSYLEHRYGTPVPLATGHRIVNGRSLWSWICPHCGSRNEDGHSCGGCGAVFDGAHYRAKKAKVRQAR